MTTNQPIGLQIDPQAPPLTLEASTLVMPAPVLSLVDQATQRAQEALETILAGERDWMVGVSLTVVPGAAQGQFEPLLVLVVTAPGVLLGERIAFNLLSQDLAPTTEGLLGVLRNVVEAIRSQRSEMAAQVMHQG